MTSTVSDNGKIVAALACPVCLDLCSDPKILPNCGHTFCATCLEPIYEQCENADDSVTIFPCPECRTENAVPTGELDELVTNYPVLRAVDVLREEEKATKCAQPGVTCPHVDFLTKSNLSICKHCDHRFCQSCMLGHLEFMKLEINFLSSGFHDRFNAAVAQLPEKVRQTDGNVRRVQEPIVSTANSELKTRDLFWEKAKLLCSEVSRQQSEIDRRLKEMNEISILYGCHNDFVQLFELVVDQDKKISKLEHVAKSSITFTSDTESMDIEVEDGNIENSDDDCEEKTPYAYREVHLAARSGDFAKLKSVFMRPTLVPTCRRFIVEHRDKNDKHRTILHQASEVGSLDIVRYLVTEQGANISGRDKVDEMPIHLAANTKHSDIVKFFLGENSQLVNAQGCAGETVLYIASGQEESLDLVRYLVDEMKADIEETKTDYDCTPLIYAACEGNLGAVEFLCERGPNLLAKTSTDDTALHFAAYSGNVKLVKFLLEKTAENLEWPDSDLNETPLSIAAKNGYLDIVQYLVTSCHANLKHVNFEGYSPLLLAAKSGSLATVKFLLQHGTDLHEKSSVNGRSIVHPAAFSGSIELIQFLLGEYPDFLDMKDKSGFTVMHLASEGVHLEIVRFLAEKHSVAVDPVNDYGVSPLFLAVGSRSFNNFLPVVKYLLESGANLQRENWQGQNVLHSALQSESADLISFLVDRDPTLVRKANIYGETPLDIAIKEHLPEKILKILKQ